MSPQESQVLQEFLNQLTQVRGMAKDSEAEAMIARAVSQQPDAAYLLVQKALLQEQALNAAKEQIAALQRQVQSAQTGGRSFLDPGNAWGNSAVSAPATQPSQYGAYERQQYSSGTTAGGTAARPGFFGGGGGSFLGSMAATAAGVAGGAFLFHGIESLLGYHGANSQADQQGIASSPAEQAQTNDLADTSDTGMDNSDLAADAGLDDIDFDSSDDSSLG